MKLHSAISMFQKGISLVKQFEFNNNDFLQCRDRLERGGDGSGRIIIAMAWGDRLVVKEMWGESLGDRLVVLTADKEELWEISPQDIRGYALWGEPLALSNLDVGHRATGDNGSLH